MKKAVVLLSGGLDSATTLYIAKREGYRCFCLIFDYGQRHRREIESAKRIARKAGCPWQLVKFKLSWKGSSLLDKNIKISKFTTPGCPGIRGRVPNTYVPARNIIFLSFALSCAEAIKAGAIFIGANAVDFSGYPDCRPQFYQAFTKAKDSGTGAGRKIAIKTPLIKKSKAGIIKTGLRLSVPFELTWSCYRGGSRPCGRCDSCYFRAKGFTEAGIKDPLIK